ncbi:MAG TPA: TMEM175 family protein [Chthoniobacterales bacterium]|nr:TMEM175 family protein [Chthoniobacterales bacterium]
MSTVTSMFGERFTHRLEAFSDLVFGFSLSLLATRLDIPADPSQVFDPTRWSTFVITFAIICMIWLAHYRIFRHHFVPQIPDVVINFVFLLGIAVLPYAVQIFLRFTNGRDAMVLYFGDLSLVFAALATLRGRALLQRRGDPDTDVRLREWRATVRQYTLVFVIVVSLIAMGVGAITREKFYPTMVVTFGAVTLFARFAVRRLPGFLQ